MRDRDQTRKLTTILSADAADYSRMMHADEGGVFRALRLCQTAIEGWVQEHQGRIFGTAGDCIVAEFSSPVEALRCAVEIQQGIETIIRELPESNRMRFRIGINLGDVIVEGSDLIGDGVNVADRIQHLAKPGGICVSATVHDLVKSSAGVAFEDLGKVAVKNIADPVHVYRVRLTPVAGARPWVRLARPGRRLGWALLLSVVAVALVAGFRTGLFDLMSETVREAMNRTRPSHASIAVLPFENLSGDASQDYFADGIAEDMRLALGRFSDLSVIAREAVEQYKGKVPRPAELSRELGVRYSLQGSVRRDGQRVRVTAVLTDARSGLQLWTDRFDGEVKDVFEVQDAISRQVVGALAIKLSDIERQRSLAKPPENLQAYDYLQRGRDHARRNTRADNRDARRLFEQAIALDPKYASAYVALSVARLATVTYGWTEQTAEMLGEAERLAHRALELDGSNAEAHAVLAEIYLHGSRYDLARAEAEQAIALNPNDVNSHTARGTTLVFAGHPEEGLKSFEMVAHLNPAMEITRTYPWGYYLARRYEDAVRTGEIALRQNPSDYFFHAALAAAHAQLGRDAPAKAEAAETLRNWPFFRVDTFARQFSRESDRAHISDGLRKAGLN